MPERHTEIREGSATSADRPAPDRPLLPSSFDDQEFRQYVRDFATKRIAPLTLEMDAKSRLDPGLRDDLFAAGLMGVEIPQSYGGLGRPLRQVLLLIEEIARVDPGVAVVVDVQNALVNSAILRMGSGDLRRRCLPRLARSVIGAYALSEDQAGSDAFALATLAREECGGYVLDGRKRFTSSAQLADIFIVFARIAEDTGDTIAAFMVDSDADGVRVGPVGDQLGVRAAATADLTLDGVRVRPVDAVGGIAYGKQLAVESLNIGRLGIAAQLVGLADGALSEAIDYARQRKQFGQSIASYQGVSFPLADVATELEAARVLLYETVRRFENGAPAAERLRAAAMAKSMAARVASTSASQAMEVLGGNGYLRDFGVEKLYRDAKIGSIYEGTSNMLRRIIARSLLAGAPRSNGSSGGKGSQAGK